MKNQEINPEQEKKAGLGGCLHLIFLFAALAFGLYILTTI